MSLLEQFEIMKKESRRRMGTIATIVLLVSLAMLTLGLVWKEKYESYATILVEDEKIIGPLMQGATVPTSVRDQAELAREILHSREVMNEVTREAGWLDEDPTPLERAELIDMMKAKLKVKNVGTNVIQLAFRDSIPERAFRTVMEFSNQFISRARQAKTSESRAAYEFISAEAERYREMLDESEQRLQAFYAENGNVKPGTGEMVDARVVELMRGVQTTALDLEEARVRARSLEAQLDSESATMAVVSQQEQLRSMISDLQAELASLRLKYHDTYPDIVSTKHKIDTLGAELERLEARQDAGVPDPMTGSVDGVIVNPLRQEIRTELSKARTQVAALEQRLERNKAWLDEAQGRGVEIGDVEAQAAELTREYEVTKEIYQDLLQRRESARIALNMDEQGEGLTMSIQEPPTVPLQPTGIQFVHFAILGPFFGLGLALGLVFLRVQFDERIRTSSTISRELQIPVLTTVPMLVDERAQNRQRRVRGSVIAAGLMLLAAYALVAALRMNDFI